VWWDITDPSGFVHRVELFKDEFWGAENLACCRLFPKERHELLMRWLIGGGNIEGYKVNKINDLQSG